MNRDEWGPGPWDHEPDDLVWPHAPTGYLCAAKRHPMWGHWCGYVRVPPEHPLHGASYNDRVPEVFAQELAGVFAGRVGDRGVVDVFLAAAAEAAGDEQKVGILFDVHGSITYAGELDDLPVPAGGWWFGFDCGQAHDLQPGLRAFHQHMPEPLRERMQELYALLAQMRGGEDDAGDTYRTLDYVVEHAKRLAGQLASLAAIYALMSAEAQAATLEALARARAARQEQQQESDHD